MKDTQHFAIEAHSGLLASVHCVELATSVYSCNWRMMRNLLGKVVEFISSHFKCLPEQWIERLR